MSAQTLPVSNHLAPVSLGHRPTSMCLSVKTLPGRGPMQQFLLADVAAESRGLEPRATYPLRAMHPECEPSVRERGVPQLPGVHCLSECLWSPPAAKPKHWLV